MVKPCSMKTILGQLTGWVRDSAAIIAMLMGGFNVNITPSRNLRRSITRTLRLHLDKGRNIIREVVAKDEPMDEVMGTALAQMSAMKVVTDRWDLEEEVAPGFCPRNTRALRDFAFSTKDAGNAYVAAGDVANNQADYLDEFMRHAVMSAKALKKVLKACEN